MQTASPTASHPAPVGRGCGEEERACVEGGDNLKNRASAWRKSRSRDAQPLGVRSRKAASALVAGPPQTSSRTSSHSRRIRRPRTAPRATLLPLTRRTRAPNGRLRNRRSQVRILSGALRRPCLRGLLAFRAPRPDSFAFRALLSRASSSRIRPVGCASCGCSRLVWCPVTSSGARAFVGRSGTPSTACPTAASASGASARRGRSSGRPAAGFFTRRTAEAALRALLDDERERSVPGSRLADVTFAEAARDEPCSQRVLSRGRRGAAGHPRLEGSAPTKPWCTFAGAHMVTHTPVCGRDAECAVLDGLLDAVRRGESRALVVEQP